MPVTSFDAHAQSVTGAIHEAVATGKALLVNLRIDQRSITAGFIAGTMQFDDESELHFREFIDVARPDPKVMYAYHYQDAGKKLIFRYDNAAHKPPLSQREHKHIGERIVLAPPPLLSQVLAEILK